ncbi:LacI family DNA-binding transcriptional regulator [Clostridiaceae bacterium M8S5]|nr:LacI family DNA-binding transcriptional regulator [Clostridiaceae bacterium M8S5]
MPVTIKDVASLANVSPSTVSRVIANSPKISDNTKKKVYKAMNELKYHPNAIARSLANRTTKTLGLVLPSTEEDIFVNPFFVQIMRGISHYAQKKNYYIMYTYGKDELDEVKHIENLTNSRRVDGIILTTVRENDKCIGCLREIDYPFVVIGRPEDIENILWVDNDNFHAMYRVVNHLIQKGHRRIGFIGGESNLYVTQNRLEGYVKALENSGINVSKDFIKTGEFTEEDGYTGMKSMLKSQQPTAVVTTDDIIAFGAIKACKEDSKDIAIVGFNNTLLSEYQQPKLSSVDINAEKLGYFAAKLLIDKLENNNKNGISNYMIDTNLIERESTKLKV